LPRIQPANSRRRGRGRPSLEECRVPETHNGRVGFGERLRRLRVDADLSGKALAERLGWPASKVSRLEHGRQTATTADIDAWTAALAVPTDVRESLVEDLRGLRVEYATWRREMRAGMADRQRVAHVLDDGAGALRALQTAVLPGLLQTPDYARAVFEGLATLYDRTDVAAAVRERVRRQQLLYEAGRQFSFIITEGALRARIGSAAVQRAALDRLCALADLDTVEVAVLPWTAELTKAASHSFDLFDDRLVLVETFTAELALREPDDIALYARLFDLYSAAALHGAEATAFIAGIAQELG
jgi:transcriptional regulator with XRE-family HTH domain